MDRATRTSGRRKPRHGFTLIELLVVITIIVVLLALLTPALDKAIYQADLTVCGAQLNAVASSTNAYAMSFKRRYPYRSAVETESDNWMQYMLAGNNAWHFGMLNRSGNVHDDRPELESFLSVNKYLNCPFSAESDFTNAPELATIFVDYVLWGGWHFNDPDTGGRRAGMKKMGDSFAARSWIDPDQPVKRYSVLASDHWFLQSDGSNLYEAAHPDRQGIAAEDTRDGTEQPPLNVVISTWRLSPIPAGRPPTTDLNFVMKDGSVERYLEIQIPFDDRLDYVRNEQSEGGSLTIVPKGR